MTRESIACGGRDYPATQMHHQTLSALNEISLSLITIDS
ncbi:Uncharacterised protein [Yersinia aleksiciae]|nr:Uncharacterised protein [Yersinia aleksiciae]